MIWARQYEERIDGFSWSRLSWQPRDQRRPVASWEGPAAARFLGELVAPKTLAGENLSGVDRKRAPFVTEETRWSNGARGRRAERALP